VIGNEKCPHIDKKSGIADCEKLGRYNPKPTISWNNKRKFDKKREYRQFIHNDGTIHNLGTFRDFRLNQMKGNPLQDYFKYIIDLQERFYEISRRFRIIADRDLPKMKLNDSEIRDLMNGVRYHTEMLVKMFRATQLMKDSINYIIQNAKQPPEGMIFELREITKFLQDRQLFLDSKIDPLAASLNEIYSKYVMPKRRKKKKIINKRISESKGGIPKSTSLPI
jgi:hypothetical protein